MACGLRPLGRHRGLRRPALGWTGDRLGDASHAAGDTVGWAGDRLSDAGETLKDVGSSALDTVSFGLL